MSDMGYDFNYISSSSNAVVKKAVQLIKKHKEREKTGMFVAEGIRLFKEIPKELIYRVLISESLTTKEGLDELISNVDKDIINVVKDSVFNQMSDTDTPQGIMAIVYQKKYSIEEIMSLSENPFFMMAENLQDPGNLGTVLRTGEGAGITALILSKGTVDIYSPKVIRSTMGSMFRVPYIYVDDIAEAIDLLKEKGVDVYAAHLKGSVPYNEPDYKKPCALIIGNEGNGLTEETSDRCSGRIRIPMEGSIESLNAAMSAGILMYEVHRQRYSN